VGDYKDMAKNTLSILSNETTLEKFKNNAFEQAKKFDIAKVLPMYEKLYEDVIKKSLVHA
jgi:L-malate glycosyltransferase